MVLYKSLLADFGWVLAVGWLKYFYKP